MFNFEESEIIDDPESPDLDTPPQKKRGITIEDVETALALGVVNKTAWLYFNLLAKFDTFTNIDIGSFAEALKSNLSVDGGKFKKTEFTEEEVLEVIAKLNKKGALIVEQTSIKIQVNR